MVREHFLAFLARDRPNLVAAYDRLYSNGARAEPGYVSAVKKVVSEATARAQPSR